MERDGVDVPGSNRFMDALRTLNAAANGLPVATGKLGKAQEKAKVFLDVLRQLAPEASPADKASPEHLP